MDSQKLHTGAGLELVCKAADAQSELDVRREYDPDAAESAKRDFWKSDDSRLPAGFGDHPWREAKRDDAFHRDLARLKHSSSFRRLQGKQQCLPSSASDFYRTRLTHSLEVEQVAMWLVDLLEHARDAAPDVRAYEALARRVPSRSLLRFACLAHDLGNPPWGHHGEGVLNELCESAGGFEGNAQVLRILRTLELRSDRHRGLNVTAAARASVVKYNVIRGPDTQRKFIYRQDADHVQHAWQHRRFPSLECQLMEVADDISYASFDLEDGLKAVLLTEGDLVNAAPEESHARVVLDRIVRFAGRQAGDRRISGAQAFHKALSSLLVEFLLTEVGVRPTTADDVFKKGTNSTDIIGFGSLGQAVVNAMKSCAREQVVGSSLVMEYNLLGEQTIRALFDFLVHLRDEDFRHLLPAQLRQLTLGSGSRAPDARERIACDFISGMTEGFAMKMCERLRLGGLRRATAFASSP